MTDQSEILARLNKAAKLVNPKIQVVPHSDLSKSGLDSMAVVALFIEFETEFGVPLSEETIETEQLVSTDRLLEYLSRHIH